MSLFSALRRFVAVGVLVVLAGCAAQSAYREGQSLVERGESQAGLAKLQEAVTLDPRSPSYRLAYLRARDRLVVQDLEAADSSLKRGALDEAEKLLQRVLAIDAGNSRATAGLRQVERLRRHDVLLKQAEEAWNRKDAVAAAAALRPLLVENPDDARARALKRRIDERTAKPSVETQLAAAYRKTISIEFKEAPLRTVFEVIARTSGLNFVFDKDVRGDQKTTVFLRNSSIESAIQIVLLTNQLEQRVLDPNSILIYPNTPAKLKDYQSLSVRTFYLANADAKSVANTLKTIVKTRDLVVDEKLNLLIMRDSPEALRIAEKLVALHDVPEPEVMLEVEILEVKRTRLLDLGVRLPDQLSFSPLPSTAGGALTVADLRNLTWAGVAVTVGQTSVNAHKLDGDTNILANPRIRARNREKAKILIGERVPNISTTSTATGFVSESVTYVDVGLKLDVEPIVYPDNEVVIKVALEVSNIVNQITTKSGSLAYQIGTRTATSVLRLRDGENQVLAGLINDEDRRSAHKLPGLGDVPIVGRLFGTQTDDSTKTEIVLSITPRVIRNIPKRDASEMEFESGTDGNFGQRAVTPGAAQAAAPVQPPASAAPAGGTGLRWHGPTQVKPGETFAVQLLAQTTQPVSSLPMTLSFDPRALAVVGVEEGDFLRQGGVATAFSSRVDPSGQIAITSTRTGDVGATGAGAVARLTLRALGPAGGTNISLTSTSPTGPAGRSVEVAAPPPHTVVVGP